MRNRNPSLPHPPLTTPKMTKTSLPALSFTLAALAGMAAAEDAPQPKPAVAQESSAAPLPTVTVVGTQQSDAERLPGTATVIDEELLRVQRYENPVQALRLVPGVNAADEDGYGLRTNIGIRGVDPNRSEKTLLMEDGVPIAGNPYGEAANYFSPVFGRYQSIEVIKGSGQILYGPQTVAGAVNFVTRPVPRTPAGFVDVAAGSYGTVRAHANYGGFVSDSVGVGVDAYGIRSDGFREADGYEKFDIAPKLVWVINDAHAIELKTVYGVEKSNATYQGLSAADYRQDPYDKYDFVKDDRMDAWRLLTHLRHSWQYGADGTLTTTAYFQHIDRSWNRALGVFNPATGSYEQGPAGRRDRQRYYNQGGVELRASQGFSIGVPANAEFGVRGHLENQERLDENISLTGVRTPASQYERETRAGAAFAQVAMHVTDTVTVTPGVRVEHIRYRSQRIDATTFPEGESQLTEVLPGLGATWYLTDQHQLYGGAHRGFSPPSYAAAITDAGVDTELDAERSWNYELGIRSRFGESTYSDLAVFYLDYSNIINAGTGSTPFYNGGEATHYGLEALVGSDVAEPFGVSFGLPVRTTITLVRATYDDDVFSGATLIASEGNEIPYSPRVQASLMAGIDKLGHRQALGFYVTTTYVGKRYADGLNTEPESANGRVGRIDDTFLVDIAAHYAPKGAGYDLYVTASNLFDHEYVATRRPEGIFAGAPLTVMGGVKVDF
jgi:Fe(3+) dicitrate transport protein